MIKTFGLTHISLEVKDLDRAYNFYRDVFGITQYFRDENSLHASTPNCKDVITFVKSEQETGRSGSIAHFGFRLVDAADIDSAVNEVIAAGGKVIKQGEFAPGVPYTYVTDPDGYEVEIWYE